MSTGIHEHSVLGCIKRMTELARNGQMFSLAFAEDFIWLAQRALDLASGRRMQLELGTQDEQELKQAADELVMAVSAAQADEQQMRLSLFGRPRNPDRPTGALGGGVLIGLIGQLFTSLLSNPAMIQLLIEWIQRWLEGQIPAGTPQVGGQGQAMP